MVHIHRSLIAPLASAPVIDRCFQLLFFLIAVSVLYRFSILDVDDPYKCKALLNRGQWLDPSPCLSKQRPLRNWQPPGCMLHDYGAKDISTCLKSKRIVLAGDSTIRQIYWAIAKKLNATDAEKDLAMAEKHGDLRFQSAGVDLRFLWDPFMNSTSLHLELAAFNETAVSSDKTSNSNGSNAGIILVGGGLWYARNIDVAPQKHFRAAIDDIVSYMHPSATRSVPSTIFWPNARSPIKEDLLLLAPVQVPLYNALSPSRSTTLTSTKIDGMNNYLHQLSADQRADVIWSYSLMTWHRKRAYEESGLHVVGSVADRQADVLLNLRCSAVAASSGHYHFDRTCCSNYNQPGWIQWTILFLGLGVIPLVTLVTMREGNRLIVLPFTRIWEALLVIGLTLCYCFYADRTQIFNKAQKQFYSSNFNILCWTVLVLGLISVRQSTGASVNKEVPTKRPPNQPFLSRDQTDEWKGWMQFIILIYHYTGASKILWIYEIIRLLVASYLFMTGFGHTVFFYKTGDYSLRRFSLMLIRLNLLSCILPYIMRTDYLFYYFAPLVTFWFVVIYVTMRIGRSRNNSTVFLISKILLSAITVTALTIVPGILERIFATLQYMCHIHWNVVEWRFRVFLDMFIVYVGMLAGVLYVGISDSLQKVRTDNKIFDIVAKHLRLIRIVFVIASLVIPPIFWAVTRRSPDKYDYNWWQPYISPLPVLSYTILRNSSRHFRNHHSSIFAWLGRCSLETFTLQYHIWLAGDTKGLLRLGIFGGEGTGGRLVDFALLTPIFLWVSWHTANATNTLTKWIIDPREGKRDAESMVLGGHLSSPTLKSEGLLAHPSSGRIRRKGPPSFVGRILTLVKDDLRIRLVLLLGVLWILNWTYT